MDRRGWKIGAACLLVIALSALLAPINLYAPPGAATPPVPAYKFIVEFGDVEPSSFESVTGLESAVSVIQYRDGASLVTTKFPGLPKYSNIVLRGSIKNMNNLWNWYQQILYGNIEKRDMIISLLDSSHTPVLVYKLTDAWPCVWRGAELDASKSDKAMEEVEITYETFMRESLN